METFKPLPDYVLTGDQPVITHFSHSQLTKPIGLWAFEMLVLGNERRRQIQFGVPAEAGGAIHDAVQEILTNSENVFITDVIETAAGRIRKHKSISEVDDAKKEYLIDVVDQFIHNGIVACEEAVGAEIMGADTEVPILYEPSDLDIPIIGYCDLVTDDHVIELKTKSPRVGPPRKDGSRNVTPVKLPDNPEFSHLMQVALYSVATGKKPILIYFNEDGYKTFSGGNCAQMQESYLQEALGHLLQRAVVRQNLLKISTDPNVLVNYMDFDFTDFRWNIGQEFVDEAKQWVYGRFFGGKQ